ncbi:MAG TPA: nitroreductase family protein [Ktedonobacterales bacterium]|jgi:F420 biosynthesis protein FbiB-like protein
MTSPTQQQRPQDLRSVLRGRQSVRHYQEREVPRRLIEEVLEAARWAPSPHGRQPWRFVVLTRPDLKEQLADAMGASWRANLAMDEEPEEVINSRLALSRHRLLHAPALIIPCLYLKELDHYPDARRQEAETIMAIQSLGAAVENLMLAAWSLGLDSGWMCAPLFCPEIVCQALDLDPTLIPHALITLGYLGRASKRREHRPIEALIARWD